MTELQTKTTIGEQPPRPEHVSSAQETGQGIEQDRWLEQRKKEDDDKALTEFAYPSFGTLQTFHFTPDTGIIDESTRIAETGESALIGFAGRKATEFIQDHEEAIGENALLTHHAVSLRRLEEAVRKGDLSDRERAQLQHAIAADSAKIVKTLVNVEGKDNPAEEVLLDNLTDLERARSEISDLSGNNLLTVTSIPDIQTELGAFNLPSQEVQNLLSKMDDESKGVKGIIKPLSANASYELQRFYDYICSTRGVNMDFNSPIYQEARKRLKMMLPNGARIFLMDKSAGPEAFVLTDGTMFISQEVINCLESVDEFVGIMAHESGHIINHTSKMRNKANNDITGFGVVRVHEAVSDASMYLVDRAEMNVGGIGDGLKRINNTYGWGFDPEHGSGGIRELTAEIPAYLMHFKFSNKQPTPMPENWKKEAKKINIKLAQEIVRRANSITQKAEIKQALESLYPLDLLKIKDTLPQNHKDILGKVISSRLQQKGYSKDHISLYLLLNINPYTILTDEEAWLKMSSLVKEKSVLETLSNMDNDIFFTEQEYSPVKTISHLLSEHYERKIAMHPDKEPEIISQDAFITILKNLKDTRRYDTYFTSYVNQNLTTDTIINFLVATYRNPSGEIDSDGIQNFFRTLYANGIALDMMLLKTITTEKGIDRSHPILLKFFKESPQFFTNMYTIATQFYEEYNPEKKTVHIDQEITALIDFLKGPLTRHTSSNTFEEKMKAITTYVEDNKLNDSERTKLIEKILHQIRETPFERKGYVIKRLRHEKFDSESYCNPEEKDQSAKLAKFNLELSIIAALSRTDNDDYYRLAKESMELSGLDPKSFTREQLWKICSVLLVSDAHNMFEYEYPSSTASNFSLSQSTHIKNYTRAFKELPFLIELGQKKEKIPQYLFELIIKANTIKESVHGNKPGILSIFSDNLESILLFQECRESFAQILTKGVSVEQYNFLSQFVRDFLPEDSTKISVLKELNMQYLKSNASFEKKVTFIRQNFKFIGIEGLSLLGEQISTRNEYLHLASHAGEMLQEFLHPNADATKLAAADLAVSLFSGKFEDVLSTAIPDEETKKRLTQQAAEKWAQIFFGTSGRSYGTNSKLFGIDGIFKTEYDGATGKVVVDEVGQLTFRSFADMIGMIQGLSEGQRVLAAAEYLGNKDGAFATEESRKKTAEIINSAVGTTGFVNTLIEKACMHADLKTAGFPLSAMLGPLLFQGLDPNLVDFQLLGNSLWKNGNTLIPPEDLAKIVLSPTRDIVAFGLDYKNHPSSLPAEIMRKSQSEFFKTYEHLEKLIPKDPEKNNGEYPKGTEAVIQAAERGSALSVRGMQLLSELKDFEDKSFNKRLSETLDNGQGMNKLVFWANLHMLSERGKTDPEFARYTRLFEQELITLDEGLGNGSEFSTRAATIKPGRFGKPKRIALHFLMPNAERHIGKVFELGNKVFDDIERTGTPEEQSAAQFGRYINELGNEWCQRDINNPTFERDDKKFQQIVSSYNHGRKDKIHAPELLFTSYYLYGDELVENATTVNRLVHDDEVPNTKKAEIIEQVLSFLEFQLTNAPSVTRENGRKRYIIHADPHLGNFLTTNDSTLTVIDRRMPLLVSEAHRSAARAMYEGDSETFFANFIEAVAEENHVSSPSKKIALARDVLFAIANRAGLNAEVEYHMIEEQVAQISTSETKTTTAFRQLLSLPQQLKQAQMIRNDESFREKGESSLRDVKQYGAELQKELEILQVFGRAIISRGQPEIRDPVTMRKVIVDALAQKGYTVSLDMDLLLRIPAMMNHLKEQRQLFLKSN